MVVNNKKRVQVFWWLCGCTVLLYIIWSITNQDEMHTDTHHVRTDMTRCVLIRTMTERHGTYQYNTHNLLCCSSTPMVVNYKKRAQVFWWLCGCTVLLYIIYEVLHTRTRCVLLRTMCVLIWWDAYWYTPWLKNMVCISTIRIIFYREAICDRIEHSIVL